MVEFTPGPWQIGPWVMSMGEHVYRVITHEGRKVSSVAVYGKRPDGSTGGRPLKHGGYTKTVTPEECDANARLTAAAPDLYDCATDLESLCAWLLHRFGPDSPEGREASFRAEKARTAIAKVTA